MLRFFQPISRDDATQQQQQSLQQSAAAAATEAAQRAHLQFHRAKPGRPRAKLDVNLQPTAVEAEEEPSKRGKYVNWFASPFIHDILAVYRLCSRNSKKTVAHLQQAFPRLLTESLLPFSSVQLSLLTHSLTELSPNARLVRQTLEEHMHTPCCKVRPTRDRSRSETQ